MEMAAALLLVTTGLAALVLLLRWYHLRMLAAEQRTYRLQFPRDVEPQAVSTFLAGLSGLIPAWYHRPFVTHPVVVEVAATSHGIAHYLIVSKRLVAVVAAHLRAALPSVRLTPFPEYTTVEPTTAAELALSTTDRPLRTDQLAAVNAAILSSLQPLRAQEVATLQWVVSPTPVPLPVRIENRQQQRQTAEPWLWRALVARRSIETRDDLREQQAKQAEPLFAAVGRLAVSAADPQRSRNLLNRLSAAFHLLNAPGVQLRRRWLPGFLVARRARARRVPLLHWPCLLNAAELAAVIGWPTNSPQLPGLTLGGCRQLAPAADIPSYGRVIAHATFPGAQRPLAIAPDDRLRHVHVIGPTGTGKSTLLLNLIVHDMAAGDGVVVIDPKGDLISDCLQRVPRHRLHEVMLLDPTDAERPVGLNLLSAAGDGAELMVEQVVGIFHNLYSAFWGPRTDDILRAALLTLTHQPGMTLAEVPLLLTDEGFRRRLVARLDEPVALEPFWAWYESLKASERSVVIGPVLNKLRSFLLRGRVRTIIGQSESTIDFTELLAEQRILFVSLAKGLLGEEAAALLGSLVVARLWQATQARAGLPPSQRPRVLVHIDEFQDYLNLPTSMADLLAQARGLGVGLTLAHQHLGQLPIEVRRAVLANARSRVVFQSGAEDARLLAREFEPHLTPADLQGLGPHEVVAAIAVGAHVAPPATGVTSPPPPATSRAASVRTASRQRYGRDRAAVERAIRDRHSQPAPAGAIGRARRAS